MVILISVEEPCYFKGATKSYFTHYFCVVITLFNAGLCRSAFGTISVGKIFFVFLCFLLCFLV